ncbi:hypothetical protein SEA_PIONEER_95 [Mycobacterium phage Pioneer]|uniref:hypothetical protein n=1 Tax=Mycobacterium phage Pioneer TaxID=1698417 RepID=UPI0006BD3049|nr:hypothetical protein AVV05_gp014 [Mycobacterium phage Pioneer]AVI04232.1 hypothetical protein SEA_PHONNEGUT_95 [Mycobacterium phage Phonnegut]AVI04391.1 hypothetical protein SEA_SCHERZO_93 [Mycobacterium phage Scherzo]QBI96402.1 hypothetical protein SEA_UGENIE5_82 [Mycobacterium phage Ugenie5]QGJ88745.1 hypothetical protein SEA_BEEMO_95 [Mycobacterium phage Beemo]ALA07906.1 hypothetical protein SEA_PIONEER_95 [Mycobacterium phage Pioneer]
MKHKARLVRADEVKAGDILLTTLASDTRCIYADTVTDVWSYDEQLYFATEDDRYQHTYSYSPGDLVTVLRFIDQEG